MTNPYQRLFFLLIFWLTLHSAFAATLSARTEPSAVALGEPFNLILELDENAPSGLPDFTPLRYDFHIHGTAHSTSYLFTNGQSKASTRWTVTLVPRRVGELTIPSIQIGQARSHPITLHVGGNAHRRQTSSSTSTPDRALFIQTKLSDANPLLNQQMLYTVKIFHYSSILDAAYQPPNVGDALVVPLGENRQYQVIEQGRPYLVEEQKYAFFPQKTGRHIIFPPKFQALIYDDIPRRAEAQGESRSLDVQPIPEGFTQSTWLPAKALALQENYDQKTTKLTEGSTLTRTITLRATGLLAELLPQITLSKKGNFKSYPERPTFNNTLEGDNVVGSATLKINYLLSHTGPITIPEQTIAWFNTQTGQKTEVTLPARILQVTPEPGSTSSTTPTKPPKVESPETTSDIQKPLPIQKHEILHRLALHITLLVVFLLFGLCIFVIKKAKRCAIKKQTSQRAYLKPLKKACLSNQPKATRDALLIWAKHAWPDAQILNLDDMISLASNQPLTEALHTLSKALYHPKQAAPWQGKDLWSAIQNIHAKKPRHKTAQKNPLPPIHPE